MLYPHIPETQGTVAVYQRDDGEFYRPVIAWTEHGVPLVADVHELIPARAVGDYELRRNPEPSGRYADIRHIVPVPDSTRVQIEKGPFRGADVFAWAITDEAVRALISPVLGGWPQLVDDPEADRGDR